MCNFVHLIRIVGDNVDLEVRARVQTKETSNRSIHWTHQYALRDRIVDPSLASSQAQKLVNDVQLADLLPGETVFKNIKRRWAVLVSRVIVKYLPAFKNFRSVVVRHIPHKYSKEMAVKSDLVCM